MGDQALAIGRWLTRRWRFRFLAAAPVLHSPRGNVP
jgi:hypothetical protein